MRGESYYVVGIVMGMLTMNMIVAMGGWGLILGASLSVLLLLILGSTVGFNK